MGTVIQRDCGCRGDEMCRRDRARIEARRTQLAAVIDEQCGTIAREVLGFDPRSGGPDVRACEANKLQAALVIAYRAGQAAR